ncbi:hypothetical protein PHLGIDRAFT_381224 [Phlebiopsis gigantea 11061_1 CR5-6]|uniref:F-box domain-containing protein n=1 Tax=Phlebiopsis gigantea (strain 11061_1 CR5-6) TaxID=745531 RepID=A0A0C3PNL6_PHLG1|nr:hypothetical protein PHLGIDRAFT_381224 [Phlebiopsis gigantea 11061_1 CR5-6]
MDEVPTEVLRRIPALLNIQDVGRLMRAGSRRIFDVCGEHLYSTIQLSMAHPHVQPHNPAATTRTHGRPMLEVLSAETPRGSLEPPARWVRHLAVAWPLFPTGEEAEYCTLLLRALSCTNNILSLELRGRSPLAWRHGLHTPAQSSHFLPRLVALKTDDVGDSIELSSTRTLEAIFVTTLLPSQDFAALLASIRLHPAALSQVQLSLEISSIQDILDTFEKTVSALPNLRVLCLEFDLGIDFPERPLAWTTVHVSFKTLCLNHD